MTSPVGGMADVGTVDISNELNLTQYQVVCTLLWE